MPWQPARRPSAHVRGIYSTTCDVSSIESIEKLIEFVKEKIGVVHYWHLVCPSCFESRQGSTTRASTAVESASPR